MKSYIILIIFLLSNISNGEITIMPFGDSITEGFSAPAATRGAYRLELENLFRAQNIPFDFVGDYHYGADGLLDIDYQARGGYNIQQMTAEFSSAVNTYQPNIALVLAGTNNHWDLPDYNQYLQKYTDLVNMIHNNSPSTEIIFSTVPKFGCCRTDPFWTPAWVAERNNVRFPLMNSVIADLASSLDYVSVVDLYSILDPATDLSDGDWVHPNILGHKKLADLFFQKIGSLQIAGDANADGIVDGSDFLIWNQNKFTQVSTGSFGGDFNNNGSVDGSDFIIWNQHKFTSNVPEPQLYIYSVILFLLGYKYESNNCRK